MKRWGLDFWTWLVAAALWGFGGSIVGDVLGWNPLIAPAGSFALLAAFGWSRRGRDLLDVFAPAVVVGYAAFVGLALARASAANLIAVEHYYGAMHPFWTGALTDWPPILIGGIAYAFFVAIVAALPASMLLSRRTVDSEAHARFWTFVKDHTQPDERPQ